MATRFKLTNETFALAGAGILAVSLQILWTQPFGDTGIRVSASDLLLPLFVLAAAVRWRELGNAVEQLQPRYIWFLLAGLTLWIAVSLLVGRLTMGAWQSWAVVNKMAGWFVLLVYFVLGAWLGHGKSARDLFLRVFFVTGWIASAVSLGLFALFNYGVQFSIIGPGARGWEPMNM